MLTLFSGEIFNVSVSCILSWLTFKDFSDEQSETDKLRGHNKP
jgi:hypothetical protein